MGWYEFVDSSDQGKDAGEREGSDRDDCQLPG